MQKSYIYNRILEKLSLKKRSSRDKGFTLVELIVVLALMAILLGVTIFSGLAWQDYSRFNHEEAVAEDIFFAAQNQLTEFDASGAMESKVQKVLQDSDSEYYFDYKLASAQGEKTKLEAIAYESGDSEGDKLYYSWDNIWKAYFKKNDSETQKGAILYLSAKKGDYQKYLASKANKTYSGEKLSVGTELLFDLVAPYVTDKSVLNGCINLEFSPEAGQVFSVCYSDVASSFDYVDGSSGGIIGINDRRIQKRKENMFGYYSADQLYEKIRGKEEYDSVLKFEIINNNVLELVVHDNSGNTLKEGDKLFFQIFDGASDSEADGNRAMEFSIIYKDDDYSKIEATDYKDGLKKATENPVTASIKFYKGEFAKDDYASENNTFDFRLPVWIDEDSDIHIVLDCADIQAQSYAYYKAFLASYSDPDERKEYLDAFRNTFSFYRFGLADDVNYIHGKVYRLFKSDPNSEDWTSDEGTYSSRKVGRPSAENPDGRENDRNIQNNNGTYGVCTTFDSFTASGTNRKMEMSNARHLYNVRYETDYKKNATISNEFVLINDIDWNEFVGKSDSSLPNNFLNSYDLTVGGDRVKSGIDYNGCNPATGGHGEYDAVENDTVNCPFPGFRCLSKNDKFTQLKAEDEEITQQEQDAGIGSYKISNLTISISANIIYGVYDTVFYNSNTMYRGTSAGCDWNYNDENGLKQYYADVKAACERGKFSGIIGLKSKVNNDKKSDKSELARAGQLPLGLFAENLGTISKITLDKHVVRGMETIDGNEEIIYTCMVGGFAGNNMGTVEELTLLDSAKNGSESGNKTHINGRTDVGGIVGRQSFSVSADTTVLLDKLKNEGTVTGYENVGGIVGRAYVHYVDDKDNATQISAYSKKGQGGFNIQGSRDDESARPRYKYYHDGYVITDKDRSMSGADIYRAAGVSIQNCENKGKVSGDSLIYSKSSDYKFDGEYLSSENRKYIHCAFIGGIAGITQDGYIIDDNNEKISTNTPAICFYRDFNGKNYYTGGFSYISIDNCKSEVLYTKTEINNMKADFALSKPGNNDCYVGGLVGYARLTNILNCNNEESGREYFGTEKVPVVIGRNYVGGIAGCSDESRYSASEGNYNAINNNLVIGEKYVGGIAGGMGFGDITPSTLSFRDPASNEASQPSTYPTLDAVDPNKNNNKRNRFATNLCNKGIVLGIKNGNFLNYISETSGSDNSAGIKNQKSGSTMIGGIVGASHNPIQGCDNIQSVSTKKYCLSLVGFTDDQISNFSNLSKEEAAKVVINSSFGGSCVGGIEGCILKYGYVNRNNVDNKKYNSKINAVVFGQDFVGGGIGMGNEEGYTNAYNFYPTVTDGYSSPLDGMVVVGRDIVGGIIGEVRAKFNFDNTDLNTNAISSPYTVYGRYGVGGAIGVLNTNFGNQGAGIYVNINLNNSGNKVSVCGIAYVGGLSGVCLYNAPHLKSGGGAAASVSDVNVYGKYFAGGIFGAYDASYIASVKKNVGALTWDNLKQISLARDSVNADAFGGGYIGLYSIGTSNRTAFNNLNNNKEPDGALYEAADTLRLNDSGDYADAGKAYDLIVNRDIKSRYKNMATDLFSTDTSSSFTFKINGDNIFKTTVPVKSKIFAGGLFGYVPEGQNLSVYNIRNEATLEATGYVGGDSGTAVYESTNSDDSFAYLGGIIGRVSKGMLLDKCSNTSKGESYKASYATYLGGLTEVNAGIIQNCENNTAFDYGSGGVGAFAGMNGTGVTSVVYDITNVKTSITVNSSSGVIFKCTNKANLNSTDGFVGGMVAADGGTLDNAVRNSSIFACINLGKLSGKDASGMVAKSSGSDIIAYCRNYGENQATNERYGIAGSSVGVITKNLEAGGLGRNDTISDPVAPMNSDDLVRNFYLDDTVNQNDLNNKTSMVNTGNVYFTLTTDDDNSIMRNLLDKYYNQTEKITATSDKARYMTESGATSSDFVVKYNVQGSSFENGLKMKNFVFVWSDGSTVSNQKYIYYVTFDYLDTNGVLHTTSPARREIVQDDVVVIDSVDAPSGNNIKGIRGITIRASADDMIGITEYQQDSVTLPYWCAYWTDSNYKHYIWDMANKEELKDGEGIGFYSTSHRTDPTTEKESGSDDSHPAVYNLQPQLTLPESDEDLNNYFNKIDIAYNSETGSDAKQIYENKIMVESPASGLNMDFFRIYWLYPYYQNIQYKYTVAFMYLDDSYNLQTVYYDRVINPMAGNVVDTSDPSVNPHLNDTLCYDEIPVEDASKQPITPVEIDIYIDGGKESFDLYYSSITWGTYSQDSSGNKVRNERMINPNGEGSTYLPDNPPSEVIVDTDLVDEKYVECSHDLDNESVRYTYQGDRWSKQLTSVKLTSGKYNLVYSKGGLYNVDNKLLDSDIDVDLNKATAQKKHDTLDKWFMDMTDNYDTNTGYPNEMFVGSN